MEPLTPGQAVDRFVVEATLEAGAVAVRHRDLGTRHALKVLKIPAPWVTERLMREGRAQSQLDHPNVVQAARARDDVP